MKLPLARVNIDRFPDGKTVVKEIPAGKLAGSDGVTHAAEVLGKMDLILCT